MWTNFELNLHSILDYLWLDGVHTRILHGLISINCILLYISTSSFAKRLLKQKLVQTLCFPASKNVICDEIHKAACNVVIFFVDYAFHSIPVKKYIRNV